MKMLAWVVFHVARFSHDIIQRLHFPQMVKPTGASFYICSVVFGTAKIQSMGYSEELFPSDDLLWESQTIQGPLSPIVSQCRAFQKPL